MVVRTQLKVKTVRMAPQVSFDFNSQFSAMVFLKNYPMKPLDHVHWIEPHHRRYR